MKDKRNKDRTKCYADSHNNARPTDIAGGDKVLLKHKQEKTNKFSLPFEPFFYKVIKKRCNSVILQSNDGVTKQRNAFFVKKCNDSRQTELTLRRMEQFDETIDLTVDSENEWTSKTFEERKGLVTVLTEKKIQKILT